MHRLVPIVLALAISTSSEARVVHTDTSVEILDRIEFVGTTARIHPRSYRMIAAVAETLVGNPHLRLIDVEVSGADLGFGAVALGRARARAIVDALVARGVARSRLRPVGTAARTRSGAPAEPAVVIVVRDE